MHCSLRQVRLSSVQNWLGENNLDVESFPLELYSDEIRRKVGESVPKLVLQDVFHILHEISTAVSLPLALYLFFDCSSCLELRILFDKLS